MIMPKPLEAGDFVALVAPSSPVSEDKIKIIRESINYLGLKAVIFKSCYMDEGYLSGPDDVRAADINQAFYDTSIKGVFCIRGGYGATRLLDMLDYDMIAKKPKAFIGYSDITALHIAFNQLCKFVTFHGPMPSRGYESMDEFSKKSLTGAIFQQNRPNKIHTPKGEKMNIISRGYGEGQLVGGNLSVIASTLGSPFEINTENKILFLEEVKEPLYKIDRNLTALRLAGKFENLAGLILGAFSEIPYVDGQDLTEYKDDKKIRDMASLDFLFKQFFSLLNIPIVSNFSCGHVYPHITLPMGIKIRLNIPV